MYLCIYVSCIYPYQLVGGCIQRVAQCGHHMLVMLGDCKVQNRKIIARQGVLPVRSWEKHNCQRPLRTLCYACQCGVCIPQGQCSGVADNDVVSSVCFNGCGVMCAVACVSSIIHGPGTLCLTAIPHHAAVLHICCSCCPSRRSII